MAYVTVVGNVGDVQLKFTPGGKAVCEVSVAENHNRKNQQGQWETESTTWRRVTFWEQMAESVANEIKKGDRVIVTGDERLHEFERKDGSKGAALEVRGRHIGKAVLPMSNQPQQNQPQAQQQSGWGQPSQVPASSPWQGQPQQPSQAGGSAFQGMAQQYGQQEGQSSAPF